MKLNINYKRTPQQVKELPDVALTANYIGFAVTRSHPEGMKGQLLRIWGRLNRKLDEAVKNKVNNITIEEAEKDLLRKSFSEASFPPDLAKYVIILQDEIDKL